MVVVESLISTRRPGQRSKLECEQENTYGGNVCTKEKISQRSICEQSNVSDGGRWYDSGGRNSGRGEVVKLKEKDVV